jgi:fatty-acid desaturase
VQDANPSTSVHVTVCPPAGLPHDGAPSSAARTPGHWSNGLDWVSVFWIGLIHLGALGAVFCFTWKGVLLVLVLGWLTGGLGVCLGYHRLLTHRSFQTFRWVRRSLALFGALAGEGPPITWIAVHRKHHQFADKEGDPHSPREGALWSHILWIFPRPRSAEWQQMIERYAKDLLKDPFMRRLDKTFLALHFAFGLALFLCGWFVWDAYTGLSFLVYGMFLRLVYVMHVTWLVNSAAHMWGYRSYDTRDDSRNLWWVALVAYGEGWHNNHHAFPARARHGHRWWELDVTYLVICAMESVGLAWHVFRGRKSDRVAGP